MSENHKHLLFATRYGHLEVVKYLHQNGADIHAENDLALRWAASNGQLAVMKYLKAIKQNPPLITPLVGLKADVRGRET